MRFVAETIARVKARPLEDVERVTSANVCQLFAIPA
ncbi:MAG: hypothetical protein ACREPG_09275 [Candidatus Binatia bacterium]